MVLVIFITMFSWEFCLIQLFSIIAYVAVTYFMTEAQASKFKAKNAADSAYNQVATDGLLNFETVKYFNAERHEEDRFEKAIVVYQKEVVNVARSGVSMSVSKDAVINIGLCSTLLLANHFIASDRLTPGGFVMFVTYNM